MSGLNVSRISDAVSLTPQQSSKPKRSSTRRTRRKKNKKQKQCSQKPLAIPDNSKEKEKEPWLDLSFLGDRDYTEKDFLCNYWRNTVADEQPMLLDYFLNVFDAHERELWQGFSNDYVPSWAQYTEVRQGGEGDDEQKLHSGERVHVKRTTEWRPGPVLLKVPDDDWARVLGEELDDFIHGPVLLKEPDDDWARVLGEELDDFIHGRVLLKAPDNDWARVLGEELDDFIHGRVLSKVPDNDWARVLGEELDDFIHGR